MAFATRPLPHASPLISSLTSPYFLIPFVEKQANGQLLLHNIDLKTLELKETLKTI